MANDYDETINSSSPDSDENTSSSNYINYGPIRFFGRKGKAPTLSTGRKSKFEQLHGEALAEREHRRERNRLLSKRLKEKRESIEKDLIEKINQLEGEHEQLLNRIEHLQYHQNYLYHKLDEVQHDPVFTLIHRREVTLFFEEYDYSSVDTTTLIATLTEQ